VRNGSGVRAACVTVIATDSHSGALTVTVAVRSFSSGLAMTVSRRLSFSVSASSSASHHSSEERTVTVLLEATVV